MQMLVYLSELLFYFKRCYVSIPACKSTISCAQQLMHLQIHHIFKLFAAKMQCFRVQIPIKSGLCVSLLLSRLKRTISNHTHLSVSPSRISMSEGLFIGTTSSVVSLFGDFNKYFTCPSDNRQCKGKIHIISDITDCMHSVL